MGVRYNVLPKDALVWIEALHIEGGVLDGLSQKFSPRLNVLIGGRGTGKSSCPSSDNLRQMAV